MYKELNVTSGEEMNKQMILTKDNCIPFNEAMINGNVTSNLFSKEFLEERSRTHGVKVKDYKEKMNPFIQCLKEINSYRKINLWFGIEPFCQINLLTVLACLESRKYEFDIELHLIDEIKDKEVELRSVFLKGFEKAFYDMISLNENYLGDNYMISAMENYIAERKLQNK